jgi:hypothetical protein
MCKSLCCEWCCLHKHFHTCQHLVTKSSEGDSLKYTGVYENFWRLKAMYVQTETWKVTKYS